MARELRVGDHTVYRDENGEYCLWPLGGKYGKGKFFKYHPKHRHLFEGVNWSSNNRGHVKGSQNGKTVMAHRLVLEAEIGEFEGEVDHLSRDPLENRPFNLRAVTSSQNKHNTGKKPYNTSGVLNVYWNKKNGKWMAFVKIGYKMIYLGFFTDLAIAAIAADFGRVHYHNNSPGDINNEQHRDLYVSILADQSHLFETERPATAIRCLLEIFQARQEELNRHTDNLEITITISPARQVVKVGV